VKIIEIVASQTTYNFEIADFHTYYVTDSKVLVHNLCKLNPEDIRYTQKSISSKFKKDGSIDDMIKGLKDGSISADDVPAIKVFKRNGKIYSLDNRRLYAFKQAGMKTINVQWASKIEVRGQLWKFTTITDGLSIRVR
ncbi:MAG: hypothetical protein IKC91_00935, partial [Clostridia bacterium]|nr:hypothetical protein [Clostridia bacterium]